MLLGGVIAAVVLAAGLGWFFGSQIQSPAEAAAEAEPPEASNITVQVLSEVLPAVTSYTTSRCRCPCRDHSPKRLRSSW